MRKLKLQLDDLTVDSFETSREHAARGTANAHAQAAPITPPDETGPLCPGTRDCSYPMCPAGVYMATDDGSTVDQPGFDFRTASCTNCDTCNGPAC